MMNVFEAIKNRLKEELKIGNEVKEKCQSENPMMFAHANGYLSGIRNVLSILGETEKIFAPDIYVGNNDWILCKDRMPEQAGLEVLATLENTYGQRVVTIIFTSYGDLKNPWYCNHKCYDLDKWRVIAWQPLPKPYWFNDEEKTSKFRPDQEQRGNKYEYKN